jgi:TPP-dependent pyruvate/acetoin dehydrogenase alpha subunit
MDYELIKKYYYKCLLIRKTEEYIEKLFSEGKLHGTTHCCIGQEYIPTFVLDTITDNDVVTSTHRSHGHFLSMFPEPKLLIDELLGKQESINGGKCGSQHLHYKNFYTNGITGGMIPVGTGIAFSKKLNNDNGIVVSFLGDGAMNEGYVMESFNFAAVNQIPILFVLEHNKYAMSTRTNINSLDRFRCFSIPSEVMYSHWTIGILEDEINKIINYVREFKSPAALIFDTYRFCGHSKSDKCEYIDQKEKNKYIDNDFLIKLSKSLRQSDKDEIIKSVYLKLEYLYPFEVSDEI